MCISYKYLSCKVCNVECVLQWQSPCKDLQLWLRRVPGGHRAGRRVGRVDRRVGVRANEVRQSCGHVAMDMRRLYKFSATKGGTRNRLSVERKVYTCVWRWAYGGMADLLMRVLWACGGVSQGADTPMRNPCTTHTNKV